jgi:hypothetical protein
MRKEMMAVALNRSASRLEADSSSARSDDDRAPQGELQPPAVANAVDDIDKLRATVGAVGCVEHRGASSHCLDSLSL